MKLKDIIASLIITLLVIFSLFGPPNDLITSEQQEKSKKYFTYPKNVLANDNHNNWACHNYANNMMRSTEPNSIFMTEGGDNQVFSLLYFSYVERKRPDVDFFDQKGNVFPRLYGDLMNSFRLDVDMIRDLRDYQLYSTGRPVYLTWERPNLHLLNGNRLYELIEYHKLKYRQSQNVYDRQMSDYVAKKLDNEWAPRVTPLRIEQTLKSMVPRVVFDQKMKYGGSLSKQHLKEKGPWYFKKHGLLYKVTPIKYAILDALEIYEKANQSQITEYVKRVSKIELSPVTFDLYTTDLEEKGYIDIKDSQYIFVKQINSPFSTINIEKYWDNYIMDYTNYSQNAPEWDILTREIFINYANQQKDLFLSKISNLEIKMSFASSKDQIKYSQKIQALLEQAINESKKTTLYAGKMAHYYYYHGDFLDENNYFNEAIEFYKKSATIQKGGFFQGYLKLGDMYLKKESDLVSNLSFQNSKKIVNSEILETLKNQYAYLDLAKKYYVLSKRDIRNDARKKGNINDSYSEYQKNAIDKRINLIEQKSKIAFEDIKLLKQKSESNGKLEDSLRYLDQLELAGYHRYVISSLNDLEKQYPDNIQIPSRIYKNLRIYDPFEAHLFLEKVINGFKKYQSVSSEKLALNKVIYILFLSKFYHEEAKKILDQPNHNIIDQNKSKVKKYLNKSIRYSSLYLKELSYLTNQHKSIDQTTIQQLIQSGKELSNYLSNDKTRLNSM